MYLKCSLCLFVLLFNPCFVNPTTTTADCVDAKSNDHCQCKESVLNCTGITELPSSFSEDVRSADFSGNNFTVLKTVPDAEDITYLNFSHCGILKIRYDAFDNLDSLTTLVLSHNSISNVTDDVFEWNPLQLQVLKLDHNKLEFIQHFLLYDLEKLMSLDLSYNKISFIHSHAFSQLKSLTQLSLVGNQLHTFDPKWVKGLHSNMFKSIKVTENPWACDCAMLPAHKWLGANTWTHSLLNNLICVNPANSARPNKAVFKLDKSLFSTCDPPAIIGISENTVLKVNQSIQLDCKLKAGTFPVPSITWIAPNKDKYSIHTADKYDGIDAFSNGSIIIHEFTQDDGGVYSCSATNRNSTVVATTKITVDMKKTVKTNNPEQVTAKESSQTFHKANASCVEGCTCISRHVDCSSEGFRLSELPGVTNFEKDILTISLANNDIPSIPPHAFKPFKQLEEIRLDNNKISKIAQNVFNLPSLSTLTMRDNRIHNIPKNLFANLEKLSILVLDNNELTEINDFMLKNLVSLQWLYIRNNKISMINSQAFASLEKIRFIHLEGNLLQTISKTTILPLIQPAEPTISKIFVDDNSFVCDCKMIGIKSFLLESKNQQWKDLFGEGIICSFPIAYDELNLVDISDKLNCSVTTQGKVTVVPNSSAMSGLWFGGLAIGVILTVATFFVWKKWRCRVGGPSVQYQNVPGIDDASEHASILSNKGGGSEAFV
uniref:Slit homolog 2 protein n=1 Tax=Phallusia mammillata TaxID=59560 RepID=A0A6F9DSD8_9ASCI|nr:slit homolog 2 protein [Phallusia mammillata]